MKLNLPSEETVRLRLTGKLFASFFNAASKKGAWIEVSEPEMARADISNLLRQVQEAVGESAARCEVKLVGPSVLIDRFKTALLEFSVEPRSCASRENSGAEVIFNTRSGRLQVSVAEEARAGGDARKIKVLIVDDSATIRKLLSSIFSRDPGIEVVATAERPSQVEELIAKHRPDVITLDIHMPEMDGVTLLKQFFPKTPIPTVIITSLSMEEGPLVLDALESGAVDYIQKPSLEALDQAAPLILEKVKVASKAKLRTGRHAFRSTRRLTAVPLEHGCVVAIGSSTGGTEAVKEILVRLPEKIPPILIVQHIPAVFSRAFANRMNELCPFEVKEARDGDEVVSNRVLIAPGGKQMSLKRVRDQLQVVIDDSAPVNRHRPSVDVLFDSVAANLGKQALGAILTGMGGDGARGLLKMRQAGARTIAQDEASCIVFGMPREAIRLGAAQEVRPLLEIPEVLAKWFTQVKKVA